MKRDRYFIVEPDGSFERIDPARATALYHQRLRGVEAGKVRRLHAARDLPERLLRNLAAAWEKDRQAKKSKPRKRSRGADGADGSPDSDVRIKRIRIEDKKRELEARIQELEAKLEKTDGPDGGASTEGNSPMDPARVNKNNES